MPRPAGRSNFRVGVGQERRASGEGAGKKVQEGASRFAAEIGSRCRCTRASAVLEAAPTTSCFRNQSGVSDNVHARNDRVWTHERRP